MKPKKHLSLLPYSLYVKCFCLPDLLAGKMDTLLIRQWVHQLKRRDWFDQGWYIAVRRPWVSKKELRSSSVVRSSIRLVLAGRWP